MTHRLEQLKALEEKTRLIRDRLEKVSANMEENEPAQVEQLLAAIEERAVVIAALERSRTSLRVPAGEGPFEPSGSPSLRTGDQGETPWTDEERQLAAQLAQWEKEIQSRLEGIYQQFLQQLNRAEQGRRAFEKYHPHGALLYSSDGTFIDQRK